MEMDEAKIRIDKMRLRFTQRFEEYNVFTSMTFYFLKIFLKKKISKSIVHKEFMKLEIGD